MSDIAKLNSKSFALQAANTSDGEKKAREVADMYEKYFMKEMMRQMRTTVGEGGFIKANNAEKIFQEQLDDEYSVEWNKRGGFGISDMVYQQLTERYADQLGISNKTDKPVGPLPLNQKMQIKEISSDNKKTTLLLNAEGVVDKNLSVKNPWAGVLQNKKILEGDQTSYEIKHDNGLESLILTHGAPSEETRYLSQGDRLAAGQSLGLATSASPLVWTIKSSVSE